MKHRQFIFITPQGKPKEVAELCLLLPGIIPLSHTLPVSFRPFERPTGQGGDHSQVDQSFPSQRQRCWWPVPANAEFLPRI